MVPAENRTTAEPFVWLLFSAGGVVAALVLPVLLVLFGVAIPLGWVRAPGYAHMLAKHRGLGITTEQRLRFVTLLSRAADLAELPADPEFRAALMGYAEWGTRLAVQNSQAGAEVAEHAPVPRWGWGVAPPYRP